MIHVSTLQVKIPPQPRLRPWFIAVTTLTTFGMACLIAATDQWHWRLLFCLVAAANYVYYRCQTALWIARAKHAIDYHLAMMEGINQLNAKVLETSIGQMVAEFYEGSPIVAHVLQIKPDGSFVLKVGDDEMMVQVDTQRLQEDTAGALEDARIRWMSAKAHSNDLGAE